MRTPSRDLPLWRGEWLTPTPGYHEFPPRVHSRFDPPRRRCPHCELVAQTTSPRCPVCDARYAPTRRERLRRFLLRQST